MTTRNKVYEAINSERRYQDERWNDDTTEGGGQHEVESFLLYMYDYMDEARKQLSRNADPQATRLALHTIRKVAALAVACMEQHGAPPR